ncbi:histidine-containing phosphotransfer protein 2-like isoform X2 [Prunus yedoensis var. nudiflora]|uniref:Histidine-containing phosphotransfer protein n=1 Tax=Prunus yedoensis var. nudiflora TaxID=2094558 RepID=A0A314Z706_PRUYE|nr:histidine-containing phosphotransfer protein 2-like isoform X2 [Prunus yedoensis var. nudiflora]
MPGATLLTQQLNNFIRSLREQGILDFHFEELKELESDTPYLVVDAITMFLRDADCSIAELLRTLGAPLINYSRVTEIAFQLKGSSSRTLIPFSAFGIAVLVVAGWPMPVVSFEMQVKHIPKKGFDRVRREYLVLRENLNQILQMEHAINAFEPRRRHQ